MKSLNKFSYLYRIRSVSFTITNLYQLGLTEREFQIINFK